MATVSSVNDQQVLMDRLMLADSYLGRMIQSSSSISFDMNDVYPSWSEGLVNRFIGRNLDFDFATRSFTGTVTGIDRINNGIVDFHLTDINAGLESIAQYFVEPRDLMYELLQGADLFTGASKPDLMMSYGGSDTIYGHGGDDTLIADIGDYSLDDPALTGNDIVHGGSGSDRIYGGGGNDHLYGFGPVAGEDGDDLIYGGSASDYIQGNAGNDSLYGGTGSDRIQGGAGNDIIIGGDNAYGTAVDGNDTINGNKGDDTIFGGNGRDLLRGGQGDDLIFGGSDPDVIFGDLGNDTIGGATSDLALDLAGKDILTGGPGADAFVFSRATYGTNSIFVDANYVTDFEDGTDTIALTIIMPKKIIDLGDITDHAMLVNARTRLYNSGDDHGTTIFTGSYKGDALIYNPAYELIILQNVDYKAIGLDDFSYWS